VNEQTLEVMPINSLWMLREKINALLASKLISEKEELERRLTRRTGQNRKDRRPYPKVHPKYRNPERPDQTWSGRGHPPRWFIGLLQAGNAAENLLISEMNR
jgi:DNA-binding protein H-NS